MFGHTEQTMLGEFETYRRMAVCLSVWGAKDTPAYKSAVRFASAFLEAALTWPR